MKWKESSTIGSLLQFEHGIYVRGDGDVLGSELGCGRRGFGLGAHHHGLSKSAAHNGSRLECVDGGVGKIAEYASAGARDDFGVGAGAPIGVFYSLGFGSIDVFQGVVDGLIFGDVGVGELLDDGGDLGEIFELELHAGIHTVGNQFSLGILVVKDWFEREIADFGASGVDAVGAENLANLLGITRSAVVSSSGRFFLGGNVELNEGGIGCAFKLAVGADVERIGLSGNGGAFLGNRENSRNDECKC